MEHITHVPFGAEETDGTIIVRAGGGRVQIGIFHGRYGDIDVVMSAEQAQELVDALGQALRKI
jgi:hypothetical protein